MKRLALVALAIGLFGCADKPKPPLRGEIEDIYRRSESLFVIVKGTEYAIPPAYDGCWKAHRRKK